MARNVTLNLGKFLRWIGLAVVVSVVSSELNKIKVPLPSFGSGDKLANILPRNKRLRTGEIDLGTQQGFNVAMEEIRKGDDKHQAKLEIGELGQVSYRYYRKEGEVAKTAKELDEQVRNGREFWASQQKLAQLLTSLTDLNVLVVVGEPRLKGAAGEWDPSSQTIRIAPSALSQGSEAVRKILNHEAIHVAQSCHNGGINYKPKSLNVELSPAKIYRRQLGSDIYSQIGEKTKLIETEAYSYEYSTKAARHFLAERCYRKSKPS
jgi:predicted SprT family Zn-dependent metalloprotease